VSRRRGDGSYTAPPGHRPRRASCRRSAEPLAGKAVPEDRKSIDEHHALPMSIHTRRRLDPLVPPLALTVAVLLSLVPTATTALDIPPSSSSWLDADGRPLPFSSEHEILDFLTNAEIVDQHRVESGINRPFKLTLERNGVRAHAVFRTVDLNRSAVGNMQLRLAATRQHDSYIFEVAAYEIAQLLGLDRVPPVVLRTIDGDEGSLQLWMEGTRTEASRLEAKEAPPEVASWVLQRRLMEAFDLLILNEDRHQGNVLADEQGKLWFIDHTRAFQRVPAVISSISVCERSFYERLKSLDPKEIRQRLRPYLTPGEIAALIARRRALLARLDALIAERGAAAVLFDLKES